MPDQQQGATILPGHPCNTPNLDRFGQQGLIFSRAYCPAPHCCPSRATFMTGLYPSEHGVYNGFDFDEFYDLAPEPARGSPGEAGAWPPLASDLESVRRDLLAKMWAFAQETNDQIFNDYLTVAMAPLGPGIVLGS
jgi:arylsulfatase A-like enzyme